MCVWGSVYGIISIYGYHDRENYVGGNYERTFFGQILFGIKFVYIALLKREVIYTKILSFLHIL